MALSVTGLGSTQQQQNLEKTNARVQAAIANLVSGNRLNQASDDVAALSIAAQLQSRNAALKQASSNLTQALSLTQVADGGIALIQDTLGKLQDLAQQAASPVANDTNRADLNRQFQALVQQIDQISETTRFNGKGLLNGDLSGDNAISLEALLSADTSGNSDLSIDDLSAASLLGGGLNLLSAGDAQAAFTALSGALEKVTGARADVGAFQQAAGFAGANIDSALANQAAALSEIEDTDIAAASTALALADIHRQADLALEAQGNRLTPSLLKLIE